MKVDKPRSNECRLFIDVTDLTADQLDELNKLIEATIDVESRETGKEWMASLIPLHCMVAQDRPKVN